MAEVKEPAGSEGKPAEEGDALSAAMDEAMAEDARARAEGGPTEEAGAGAGEESPEEIRARMEAALREEQLYQRGAGPARVKGTERRITSYDFAHPARINRPQLRALEGLHDNLARLLSRSLSGALRQVVDVDMAFVDQTTYAEFVRSLSNPCLSYAFSLGDAGRALFDLAMPIVFSIVDRSMGGTGSSEGMKPRQVTPIEIELVNSVAKRIIQDLEATWQPIAPLPISDVELETSPEFIELTPKSEIVILIAFEINTPKASGLMSLCYPFFTLEPLVHLFGRTGTDRAPRQRRAERHRANRLRLGDMDLDLVAELGRARISTAEAAGLAPGDVIRLESRARGPVCVYLGGQAKLLARPFEEGGEVKLRVAGRIPPSRTGKHGTVSRD